MQNNHYLYYLKSFFHEVQKWKILLYYIIDIHYINIPFQNRSSPNKIIPFLRRINIHKRENYLFLKNKAQFFYTEKQFMGAIF